jgi:hypothetical protein
MIHEKSNNSLKFKLSRFDFQARLQGSIYWKILPPLGGGGEYQPMSFGGKIMEKRREKGGKCKRKKGKKIEERGKKMRKGEAKG